MVSSCEAKSLVRGALGMSINNSVNSITIVTAFFDIGRGDWSTEKGHSSHLLRNNQTYLSYFENLAKLDNEMVVFTTEEIAPFVIKLRKGKKTEVVIVDLDSKFKGLLTSIRDILKNADFMEKIPEAQRKNPEYWSEKYVLINNLKTYFVHTAIKEFDLVNDLVAWVDFGYCRDTDTLANINNWYYNFDAQYIHLFTLKRSKLLSVFNNPNFPYKKHQITNCILNNKATIIGGVIVGHKQLWNEFLIVVKDAQRAIYQENMVDDDQGVYLMCNYLRPDLIKLHYLGKDNNGKKDWFGTMQKFHV